ncbi:MAG: acetylornithine transaminase [Deltaproteobacteria bacterium]|nr:acetylornithine transaminase [Deltaproteobacteria bacterium]
MTHSNQELAARAQKVLFQNYRTQPIALLRGEGSFVWDADGKKYLDCIGGIATVSLGHANKKLIAAAQAQLEQIWHASNLYYTEPQIRLAEHLTQRSFADRVFFCNSGAEANEGMIKLARHFHVVNGQPERVEILCMENSFHGRTMGALAATGQPKYQQGFGPLPGGFKFIKFGDVDALRANVGPHTCAVMLEPVQGEAGVLMPPKEFLPLVRELTTKYGALMLLDEVQGGMGRTGKLWCHEWFGVTPDVMSLAKGIAGGMPLGAILAKDHIAKVLTPGTHASTFGGNPIATAVACAVMEQLDDALLSQIQARGEQLSKGLAGLQQKNPKIAGERGMGLWRGLLLNEDLAGKAVGKARDLGLLVNGIGERILRIAPPLTIGAAEIDQCVEILGKALAE